MSLRRKCFARFSIQSRKKTEQIFIHWNMRDMNYGFRALEHRFRVLGGEPFMVADDRKEDISRLFVDLYGVEYIKHPRLENLLNLNAITGRDFMTGAEEAKAFDEGKFVELHRSTLRKVGVFCDLLVRAFDGKLKTLSKWHQARGLSLSSAVEETKKHPISAIISIIGIIIFIIGIIISVFGVAWRGISQFLR